MSLALSSVVGTIRVVPYSDEAPAGARSSDDSTLQTLLSSYADADSLDESGCGTIRLFAATRLCCHGLVPDDAQVAVRANLARLLDELTAEYDELNLRRGN